MFSAIILICSNLYLQDCSILTSVIFFPTELECRQRVEKDFRLELFRRVAVASDGTKQERNMVDYTCFAWNSTKA